MWLDNESSDAVTYFWKRAGEAEAYPRNLERPLAMALPVALVKMPRLSLREIETWLRLRGVLFSFQCESKCVRGCLVAFGGRGIIFVDGSDLADELRFTIAHEIAHYLTDYWFPRQKAIGKYGESIANVFDGLRPPTTDERLYAVLGGTKLGVFINLMERSSATADETWKAETRADKIALALLAPPDAVIKASDVSANRFDGRVNSVVNTLTANFGLPGPMAQFYGVELLNAIGKGRSWVEAIRYG